MGGQGEKHVKDAGLQEKEVGEGGAVCAPWKTGHAHTQYITLG